MRGTAARLRLAGVGALDPPQFYRIMPADSTDRRNSAREHSYLVITRDVFSLTA
jgi:hypothetical protein